MHQILQSFIKDLDYFYLDRKMKIIINTDGNLTNEV